MGVRRIENSFESVGVFYFLDFRFVEIVNFGVLNIWSG